MGSLAPSAERIERFRGDLAALAGGDLERLAVAVSGGADSLALLLLAAAALPGRVDAVTVDHGLRPASADEARGVASLCARLGVPHATLEAAVDTSRPSLQQAAREARYAALAGWMAERFLSVLATAHHVEDQAETLLMRLLRGSGVGGLSGIRPAGPLPGGRAGQRVVRPLLGWRRAELARIVADAGLEAVSDPSNADPRFDRARLRARLTGAEWLDPLPLARSAAALAEANEALDWMSERLWAERVVHSGDEVRFAADGLPPEAIRRILARILSGFDAASAPRGDQLGRLAARLAAGGGATLAGAQCKGGPVWTFAPAPPRRAR